MAEAMVTTDHEAIRKWVEARGGRPARLKKAGRNGAAASLRIDYAGVRATEPIEAIAWGEWFDIFDHDKLAFLHEGGPRSRVSKLVSRAKIAKAATPRRAGAAKRTTTKRATAKRSAAKRKTGAAKVTAIGRAASTTSRKAPRAMAARMGKRPTAAKKRTATKKRGAAKKRGATAKRPAAKR